ncbi:MAG: hypothetical protein ACREFR_03825, partial [Limisphaerales bacterium]
MSAFLPLAMTFRISFAFPLVALLSVNHIRSNPIVGPANIPARVYIRSEHLDVIVSPTVAAFKGTFTFAAQALNNMNEGTQQTFMLLPIWFPQQKSSNPAVSRFWDAFGTNLFRVVRPRNREVLEKAVGLNILLGKKPVPV